MTLQLDIFASRAARDEGINRSTEKANRDEPGWSELAYGLLQEFLTVHSGEFLAEDVRAYAALNDFPLPENARAWGGVMQRARREGLIITKGTKPVRNVKAHRANAAVWVKA